MRIGGRDNLIRILLNADVICESLYSHLRDFSRSNSLSASLCRSHLFIQIDSLISSSLRRMLGGTWVYKIIFFGSLSAVHIIVENSIQRIGLLLKSRRLLDPVILSEHLMVLN